MAYTVSALGRWTLAALVASAAYVLAYSQDVTLFYYYPMVGEWHWLPQSEALGPRITYYGWKAIGLLAGGATLLLPRRWTDRLPADTVWVGALLLAAIVCVHESHWFLK
ncbi:MAG: hypothetical protein WA136_13400 [Rhodoferax sp.]